MESLAIVIIAAGVLVFLLLARAVARLVKVLLLLGLAALIACYACGVSMDWPRHKARFTTAVENARECKWASWARERFLMFFKD